MDSRSLSLDRFAAMGCAVRGGAVDSNKRAVNGASTQNPVRCFAIVGPLEECTRGPLERNVLKIGRFVVVGARFSPETWGEAGELFGREAIPALRAAL